MANNTKIDLDKQFNDLTKNKLKYNVADTRRILQGCQDIH